MDAIDEFLSGSLFVVAGASKDRAKFGNRVLRAYLDRGISAIPLHPREAEIEGVRCVARVGDLPVDVYGISIVTPPPVTEQLIEAAAAHGIRRVWMQPGADSDAAITRARELGLRTIAGGPCVLVELARRDGR